jgi:hypothetical protein
MTRRALGSIVLLISILVLPYWIYIPILFIAIVLLPFYWEGILFAFLVDILYGSGVETGLYALILLVVLLPVRKSLRAYV